MATDSKQNIKTLRVDNWAVFFLQRLQLMFAKGDCCDLTLKFHTGQELKVHRLVLITCTTFFESMEREGSVINMPEALPYSVVQPIINFLYSGKLEFKSELHSQLLNTSKNLNITILSKLLVTQKNDNGLAAALAKPGETKKPQRTFLATRIGPAPAGGLGGRKLPIWRQRTFPLYRPDRNRIVKDEEPRPMRFEWPEGKEPTDSLLLTSPSFTPLSYKSEPVFTPSNPPLLLCSQPQAPPSSPPETPLKRKATWPSCVPDKVFKDDKKEEVLKEVKKEAPIDPGGEFSDDDDGHFETIHTYGDSDDEQDTLTRAAPSQPVIKTPPTPQLPSAPLPIIQTYRPAPRAQLAQQQVQEQFEPLAESTPAIPSSSSLPTTPKPILKQAEPQLGLTPSKKVRFSIASDEEKSNPEPHADVSKTTLAASPPSDVVFESQSVPSPPPNTHIIATNQVASQPEEFVDLTDSQPLPISNVIPPSTTTITKSDTVQTYSKAAPRKEKKTFSPADSANHAKIIAEVLKKYPDLVKNNKNIRLKISAPGSSSITNTLTLDTKRAAGKAYVVVKSSVKTEPPSPSKVDTPSSSAMMAPRPITLPPQPSVQGPWMCSACDSEGGALKFSSYYEYRRHFVDVHNEKFDSRTCEYCGYKTSKRNLYLYHLFTKHNVAPPKNIAFPKCDQCGYVALSDGLLQKHVATHKPVLKKDWPCPRCEVVFVSHHGLQSHVATCRGIQRKSCPICQESFISDTALSEHLKHCGVDKPVTTTETSPENTIGIYEEPGPQPEQAVEMIEVPLMNTDALGSKSGHTYVQLPSGLILTDGNNVLLPAAEGDDLNAVGTNMGGPMGLTMALPQDQHVILLDANSEFFIQGNDQVIVRRLNPVNSSEEYIVPEVLDESMQQIYTTQGIPYSVATTAGNMVTCPVVPIQSSSQDLDKQEDTGNTVVSVQDHVDPTELNIQHHVSANDMESIIVHDTSSNSVDERRLSTENQMDIYVEEPQDVVPQQHHMTINKELMDVVAMEVQRAPMLDGSSVVMGLPEMQAQTESVLRRPEREVVGPSANSYATTSIGMPEDAVLDEMSVVQEVPVDSAGGDLQPSLEESSLAEETSPAVDSSIGGDDGEKISTQAAKVDSLVKDWGFDNEEEAGDVVNDDSDSDEGTRTGPSRVTVEL